MGFSIHYTAKHSLCDDIDFDLVISASLLCRTHHQIRDRVVQKTITRYFRLFLSKLFDVTIWQKEIYPRRRDKQKPVQVTAVWPSATRTDSAAALFPGEIPAQKKTRGKRECVSEKDNGWERCKGRETGKGVLDKKTLFSTGDPPLSTKRRNTTTHRNKINEDRENIRKQECSRIQPARSPLKICDSYRLVTLTRMAS